MKKIISVLLTVFLMSASVLTVSANPQMDNFVSIPNYNDTYSAEEKNSGMLSLDEYAAKYSSGKVLTQRSAPLTLKEASPEILSTISGPKSQTKSIILHINGTSVGTIKLNYKTAIQGGRPQFLYDTCYLSHPNLTTYWSLEYSNVEFSGDRIGVYFSFIYGAFQDYAWVYFYPS